jgi:hypothetical protein
MNMRTRILIMLIIFSHAAIACPVCDKQQPSITRGLTHGAGPQSNWDWVIIGVVAALTLVTLVLSIRYLVKPGEKESSHIKQSILSTN